MEFKLINDDPVLTDGLGRAELIEGLTKGVEQCEMPFVLAINGGWGTGKTSILKCMEHKLNPDKENKQKRKKIKKLECPTVWFSPWKFQFEESPAVSLLQQIRETALEERWVSLDEMKRSGSKLLNLIGTLAGEIVFKAVTGQSIKAADIIKQGTAFEEKYFEAKQLTTRMHHEFENAIKDLTAENGRLILFIDDLDRCRTENALRLLEALKLFFNSKNCVYVIAIDMENLAKNLKEENKLIHPRQYLEKIFQMVYTLPNPDDDAREKLLAKLLKKTFPALFASDGPTSLRFALLDFLGHNPRALKQFCNSFILERQLLIRQMGETYDPAQHLFLQILQHCFPTVYKWFRRGHTLVVSTYSYRSYDTFLTKCFHYFVKPSDTGGASEIPVQRFEPFFIHMPPLDIHSPLEEDYIVVTVNFRDSSEKGVLCLENLERNQKIKPGSNLSDAADLANTILRNLNLSRSMLDLCDFSGADLSKTVLSDSDCYRSRFSNARFTSGEARRTRFDGADLTGMEFDGAVFSDALFENAVYSPAFQKMVEALDQDEVELEQIIKKS